MSNLTIRWPSRTVTKPRTRLAGITVLRSMIGENTPPRSSLFNPRSEVSTPRL